jgi:hypothetical protein
MHEYLTIRSNGFVTYCDGLIASIEADQAQAYLLSLVGSSAQIQATTAHFYNGGFSRISGIDPEPLQLGRSSGTIRSIRRHNHPSGGIEPSREDLELTHTLTEILRIIDVRVLDHLIVGDEIVSLSETGHLPV